ncbi:MAG TPA: class I SAM-dependent methyltransferase [Ottowia sp.]|nr:class I SAM-dependent methyltransferase [Ottowia sp.]
MASAMALRLRERFYRDADHPYRQFEARVESLIGPGTHVLLDAGCGRTVPVLRKFLGKVDHLIGVELVPFTDVPPGIETHNADLGALPLPDASVDLVISRSVFEHLTDPQAVYREMARVLRPGGRLVFLTANLWDYGTQVARLVPNRLHGKVVKVVEGRAEEDTFPTAYKTNTRGDVERLAAACGMRVTAFDYLSQYPNYLMFSGPLFVLGMVYEKLIANVDALRFLRGWILVTLQKEAK